MVNIGETAVLECMAAGSPKPKLSWYKDGKPLEVTERHFFTAENQLLIIVHTRLEDSGEYMCNMSNTLGTDRGISYLAIQRVDGLEDYMGDLPLTDIDATDETTTTGIIIIAVVCCVVGTSLVWVIIIYKTRKRGEEYSSTPTDETTLPGEIPSTPYHVSDRDNTSPGLLTSHLTTAFSSRKYRKND